MSFRVFLSAACVAILGCGTNVDQRPTDGGSSGDAATGGDAGDAGNRADGGAPPGACPRPVAGDPDVQQALPSAYVDTTWVAPTGMTLAVASGGSVQAALDAAQPGDVITLEAGASFQGPFTLPKKNGAGWIVVRTSASDGDLPPPGTRITPAAAPLLPKLLAPTGGRALDTAPGAHHYRFVGVEFMPTDPAAMQVNEIIVLGDQVQKTLAQVAHDIILDRVYVHGTKTAYVKRGIDLESANTAVIDSWISEIHVVGQDNQAIAGFNGPGPYKIVNNHLEAATENVIFGGADPQVPDLVPSDIEIAQNHFYKPLTWKKDDPSYAGTEWAVKNILELKNARRVLVQCNVFENNWVQGQVGFAIVLTPRNQDGTAPWCSVEDVTFIKNIVRHSASGVNTLGTDSPNPSGPLRRVVIQDNLFDDIDGPRWSGGGGILLQVLSGVANLKFDHNTGFHSGNIITADGAPSSSFIFTNVITPHNAYGVIGSNSGIGNPSINTFFPGAVFRRNVIAALPNGFPTGNYPPDNFFPATLDAVGFVDRANGDYRLDKASPYHAMGTDGKDVGADIVALAAATSGVVK